MASEGGNDRLLAEAEAWLAGLGRSVRRLRALPGDVSPRRYLRVELDAGESRVLALYPAEVRQSCSRFARTTALLEEAGIRVPAIVALDCERGFMLMEDVGAQTLYGDEKESPPQRRPYLETAVSVADRFADLPRATVAGLNPALDESLLGRELRQTWDVFLAPRRLIGGPGLAHRLDDALRELCARLGEGPLVPCHRDFMVRNLVPLQPPPALAVLDHQDLRLGPPLYDLASLLNDSYFPSREVELQLAGERLADADRRLRYHRAAAQRTLKAVGTFAVFARRGFDRHLRLIPPTLGRSLRHLSQLPETADLAAELETLWAPTLGSASPQPIC